MLNYFKLGKWSITKSTKEMFCVFKKDEFDKMLVKEPKKLDSEYVAVKLSVNNLKNIKLLSNPIACDDFYESFKKKLTLGAKMQYVFEKDTKEYKINATVPWGIILELDKHIGFDEKTQDLKIDKKENFIMVCFKNKKEFILLEKNLPFMRDYLEVNSDDIFDEKKVYKKGKFNYVYIGKMFHPELSISTDKKNNSKILEWKNKFSECDTFIELVSHQVILIKNKKSNFDSILNIDKMKGAASLYNDILANLDTYLLDYHSQSSFSNIMKLLYQNEEKSKFIKTLIENGQLTIHMNDDKIKSLLASLEVMRKSLKSVVCKNKSEITCINDILKKVGVDLNEFRYENDELSKGVYYYARGENMFNGFDRIGLFLSDLYTPLYTFENAEVLKINAHMEIDKGRLFMKKGLYEANVDDYIKSLEKLEKDISLGFMSYFCTNFSEQLSHKDIYPLYPIKNTSEQRKNDIDKLTQKSLETFYKLNIKNLKASFFRFFPNIDDVCKCLQNKKSILDVSRSLEVRRNYNYLRMSSPLLDKYSRLSTLCRPFLLLGCSDEYETKQWLKTFCNFEKLYNFLKNQ